MAVLSTTFLGAGLVGALAAAAMMAWHCWRIAWLGHLDLLWNHYRFFSPGA